jgi:phosphoglycerate dehydrogenase-like enzyme
MKSIRVVVIADPDAAHLKAIRDLAPTDDVRIGADPAWLAREIPEAEVVLHGGYHGREFRQAWPLAHNARWVHSLATGVENMLSPELIASPVPLTNARGVYAEPLAEFVLAAVLHFAKRIPQMMAQQRERHWETLRVEMIAGTMMGIVGYGEIGQAAGRLAKAVGMRVQASRRRPSQSAGDGVAERVLGSGDLAELARTSDYLVLAAPNAPGARHLIGTAELAAMKPSTVVINVGRGSAIDESALVDALKNRRIAGAALDVFEEEPLAPEHPFYSLDNVLISPHSADRTPDWQERAVRRFLENLERYREGRPLLAVVDKAAGY